MRPGYKCRSELVACLLMRWLAAPCRCHDLELAFDCGYYVLLEVDWVALEVSK